MEYNKNVNKVLPVLLVGLIGLNVMIDGYRWQMLPIYVLSVFVVAFILKSLFHKSLTKSRVKSKGRKIIGGITLLLLFSFSLIFPLLLPVKDLPSPSGPFSVGTSNFRLTDSSREEIFTLDEDDIREFLVSVWYPADIDKDDSLKTYWDEDGYVANAFGDNSGMGSFFFSHLSLVKTNSYIDASISKEQNSYPVIIYSHGFNGLNTDNTMLFESLASKGYIVFSINHTYEAVASLYPNGEFITSDFEYFSENYLGNEEEFTSLMETFNATEDIEIQKGIVQQIMSSDDQLRELVKIRTEDVSFLLDEMVTMNQNNPILNSSIDLTRIGMLGYSLGGATATDMCILDSRIQACINMDGWPYGELFNADNTVDKPYLLIGSERVDAFDEMVDTYMYEKLANDSYIVTIKGAEHPNFLDFPYLLNIFKYLGFWGPIDSLRLETISEDLVSSFFDKYLKNEDLSIENIADKYEEATYRGKALLE